MQSKNENITWTLTKCASTRDHVQSRKSWGIWPEEYGNFGTLMESFYPKEKMYELKVYRGVMCHDNEEWCKDWKWTDVSFQNWHEEFDEFWQKHPKVLKIAL